MTTEPEPNEPWLWDYRVPLYPELEEPLHRAIDAYGAILKAGAIAADDLEPIVEAVMSSRVPLLEHASGLLSRLTGKFPEACDALLALSHHPKSHVRFNAIICISDLTPLALAQQILCERLRDKGARVRLKAADWILRRRRRECIPNLESALSVEKNDKTRETIEFGLRLLRDGYILGKQSQGQVSVTFLPKDSRTICKGAFVDQSELTERGIEVIVRELVEGKR